VFPYKEIERNSKIIIYGAGKVGTSFYSQISDNNYCKIVGWIDSNYVNIKKNAHISGPEILKDNQLQYDYIVVAILSKTISDEVALNLVEMGIAIHKIWTPYLLDCDSFIFKEKKLKELKPQVIAENTIAFLVDSLCLKDWKGKNIIFLMNSVCEMGYSLVIYSLEFVEEGIHEELLREMGISYDVVCVNYMGDMHEHSIIFTTSTRTTEEAKKNKEKFGEIICFVQEYEAYKFPRNEGYYRCEEMLKNDFIYLCLGEWCEYKVKKKANGRVRHINFLADYESFARRRFKTVSKESILVYCNPNENNICYKIILKALRKVKDAISDIDINIFGVDAFNDGEYDYTIRNLKMLEDAEQRAQVFTDTTLGIICSGNACPSYTYEMMMCGCPVLDINTSKALIKYGNRSENVMLAEYNVDAISDLILESLSNYSLLQTQSNEAQKWSKKIIMSNEEVKEYLQSFLRY